MPPRTQNFTCIVVDDEPLGRELIETHLHQFEQFELVASCASAIEANRVLSERPVDLVFLDIEMPVMKGTGLCKAIAEEFPERSFPIFVVTGVTDLIHRSWSRQIANLAFIEKPISVRSLIDQLGVCLQAGGKFDSFHEEEIDRLA